MNKTSTILVVDDELCNRNVVSAQLKGEGYRIICADSGEAALGVIEETLPDLILLDVMMPGISGFDVAEILKGEDRTANIPIIMLTALSDSDSRLAAFANGAEEFLTKPIAKAELVMRVRNLLRLKNYQDDLVDYSQTLAEQMNERTQALALANAELKEVHVQLVQSEQMAALGQLAAGLAHEINNPIGFVSSNLTTLKDYASKLLLILEGYESMSATLPVDSEIYQSVQRQKVELDLSFISEDMPMVIDESIEGVARVAKIVQDLKSFSRVEAEPKWEMADLHKCLDSTVNIAVNEIKCKARVVREYGDIPPVECQPSRLNQVFLNLLVNAAHAIPEKAMGVITLRTGCDGERVWVDVCDTGSGIAPENMEKIFNPFFTTKPVGRGTGLGLSVSYGIVQQHKGLIKVHSELGKGTIFRVEVPRHQTVAT